CKSKCDTLRISKRSAYSSIILYFTGSTEFHTKHRTVEMTWGETDYTQRQGNHATPNESRCFALTSNDLFGAALFSKMFFLTLLIGFQKFVA
ncbi:MAG: hypothetical protein M3Q33_07050, partial [Acidobacteriota bacterium]|nr:hypothetical protein [Acidobacteriota bacterium]